MQMQWLIGGSVLLLLILLGYFGWRSCQQQQQLNRQLLRDKRQQQNLQQALLDLPFVGWLALEPDSKQIKQVNTYLCQALACERDRLLGQSLPDLMSNESRQLFDQQVNLLLLGACETLSLELCLYGDGQRAIYYQVEFSCIRSEHGAVDALYLTLQDISERKQLEFTLQKRAYKLFLVADAVPVPLMLVEENGQFTYFNKACIEILGYRMEDVSSMDNWWAQVIPDDGVRRQVLNNWQADYVAQQQGGVTPARELALLCADGVVRTFVVTRTQVPDLAEYVYWDQMVTLIDITERLQAESRVLQLSQAVEQFPSAIMITDLDSKIEYVNEGFTRNTGYLPEEVLGRNPRVLKSGRNSQLTYMDMWGHLTRGLAWQGELINRRKDGREYVEMAIIAPLRGSNGKVSHYVAIKEDITARKAAEVELNEKLEELNRWHEVSSGREMRIIELKHEVNGLAERLGEPPPYLQSEWSQQWDQSLDEFDLGERK